MTMYDGKNTWQEFGTVLHLFKRMHSNTIMRLNPAYWTRDELHG